MTTVMVKYEDHIVNENILPPNHWKLHLYNHNNSLPLINYIVYPLIVHIPQLAPDFWDSKYSLLCWSLEKNVMQFIW